MYYIIPNNSSYKVQSAFSGALVVECPTLDDLAAKMAYAGYRLTAKRKATLLNDEAFSVDGTTFYVEKVEPEQETIDSEGLTVEQVEQTAYCYGIVGEYTYYEHPVYGDEYYALAIKDGTLYCTRDYDVPSCTYEAYTDSYRIMTPKAGV